MLLAIGLDPVKDVFIANIVKCRPPNNRSPKSNEIENCIKYLKKQIEIIQPKVIVLLGKSAVKGICPSCAKESMEKLRSMSKSLGILDFENIPVIVTYHPSALLRTPWRKVGAKEDFKFIQCTYDSILN
jgi:DNA polymerase